MFFKLQPLVQIMQELRILHSHGVAEAVYAKRWLRKNDAVFAVAKCPGNRFLFFPQQSISCSIIVKGVIVVDRNDFMIGENIFGYIDEGCSFYHSYLQLFLFIDFV